MYPYTAPLADMQFVLRHIAKTDELSRLDGLNSGDLSPELISAVLEEAAKFTGGVLAPLNHSGDRQGAVFENGVVRTPDGFKEAYAQFVEGGWQSLPFDEEDGGQGLPWVLQTAVCEMLNSANLSFALAPLLTQGAIDALIEHGSELQKKTFLPQLITGKWNGTMNLTEPQAGTDVGAVRTRAERAHDGTYRITGNKIFITWGENDCAENTVHMVLARVDGAPAGTKGISLFIVPKRMVNADGSPGARNDLRCSGIEHKLGIHGSPTCSMSFGGQEGAVGYLIGEENRGMQYMFTMMNNARLAVGVQGLAIAERAYQAAVIYAGERKQSAEIGAAGKEPVAIIRHPDVKRNLLLMKSQIEAMRGLAYYTLAVQDRHRAAADGDEVSEAGQIVGLLVPLVKAWCTDLGVEIASIGVQIHGGMGYMEETGAAQYYRDARILPVYEGTNGVQALDLIGRKTFRDQGAATRLMFEKIEATIARLDPENGASLTGALKDAERALAFMLAQAKDGNPKQAAAGATPYQELLSLLFGGWIMAERQLAAKGSATEADQTLTTRFFMTQIVPRTGSLLSAVEAGDVVNRFEPENFSGNS